MKTINEYGDAPGRDAAPVEEGNDKLPNVSRDVLHGAAAIAEFLFGNPAERRRVYDMAEAGMLPIFRFGRSICARRTTLLEWIAQQERAVRFGGAPR